MLHGYFDALKRTGRTTLLTQVVSDGDIIITDTNRNKELLDRMLIGKKSIRVIVTNPYYLEETINRLSGVVCNNLYFDHTWLEKSFVNSIDQRSKDHEYIKRVIIKSNPDCTHKTYNTK